MIEDQRIKEIESICRRVYFEERKTLRDKRVSNQGKMIPYWCAIAVAACVAYWVTSRFYK